MPQLSIDAAYSIQAITMFDKTIQDNINMIDNNSFNDQLRVLTMRTFTLRPFVYIYKYLK